MVGVLGWLDTVLPPLVHRVWLTVVAGLCLAAAVTLRWSRLTVLAALVAAVALVPAVVGAWRYDDLGLVWQGRYTLPLAAGVPILAGLIAADGWAPGRLIPWLGAGALACMHLLAFAFTLRRHVTGVDGR
jgi:Predicted membrane protein (DUF2142)